MANRHSRKESSFTVSRDMDIKKLELESQVASYRLKLAQLEDQKEKLPGRIEATKKHLKDTEEKLAALKD